MKHLDVGKKTEGTITVFLTLILTLILSLLLTIIEGARVNTAAVAADRALSTAMDSVLAEYYKPLWKEYHIFAFNTGNKSDKEKSIAARLSDYMSYTFSPEKDRKESSLKNTWEIYGISSENLKINNLAMLTDYKGKLLINQAAEYMKYRDIGDGLELVLDKMSLLEKPKKVSAVYEEKQKVEEELVEIDQGRLELMKLFDGIKTGKKGIEVNKNGALVTVPYFIKKIYPGTVSKEGAGINQESIFLALKGSYYNPNNDFISIDQKLSSIEDIITTLSGLENDYNTTSSDLTSANSRLSELNSSDKATKEIKKQIKAAKNEIQALESQQEAIQAEISRYKKQKNQLMDDILAKENEVYQQINQINPLICSAEQAIDKIINKSGKAEKLLNTFAEKLNKEKDQIGEDLFAGMEDDLNDYKEYTNGGGKGYESMKQILAQDRIVLNQTESDLNHAEQELQNENFQSAKISFQSAGNKLSTYQIQGLTLDYSSLVLNKDKVKNPIDEMNSLLQDGIMSMVIDPSKISDKELPDELLPSEIAAMAQKDGDFLSDLSSFFTNAVIGGKNSGTGSIFGDFGNNSDLQTLLEKGFNEASEQLLFQEYLREHFTTFPKEGENLKARKPSALSYEQEYLTAGNSSDEDNLSSVVSRIIGLRTILDFVSLLGDKAKCSEAEIAAASLVGFTGLPVLVSITKTLILLAWSFAEALVDICALLMGREVPVIKKKIVLELPDLFLLNRSYLQEKVKLMKSENEITLSYPDYLRIFLLFKNKEDLAYRSMDLIQENVRIRYDNTFAIQNCMFGYRAEAEFKIPLRFIRLAFLNHYLDAGKEGFLYRTEANYSY